MIDLYYWMTPNGHKIVIFLEEAALAYKIHPINIFKDEQFAPDFLKIAPNNRIPAIVDQQPKDGGAPISIFESGAILLYLAKKTEEFYADDQRTQIKISEWLMWQMGGFGPMLGQNHHFSVFAPEKIPYAIDRYQKETKRLYGVLDRQLAQNEFVAGAAYSIADMAIYPWSASHEKQQIDLADFPNVRHWFAMIHDRPAVIKAYEWVDKIK